MESGLQVEDVGLGHEQWHKLAEKHWLGSQKTRKVRTEVIKKDFWDVLEKENFAYSSLLTLESLELLESYLWPGFNENGTNHHVLLIAVLLTVKAREKLTSWDLFASDPARFSALFRRVLALSLDSSLNASVRQHLLITIIHAFQSLDNALVRKECAPLVSISLWHNLATENTREEKLDANAQLRKAWRASSKRYEAADDEGKAKLRFERSWLYSLLVDFLGRLYVGSTGDVEYCERFLEFIADLESQMPTRRYVNTLLRDLNFLSLIKLSPMLKRPDNGLLRDLYILLRHYVLFPIDDHTGIQYSGEESHSMHDKDLARLQRLALKSFSEKLTILALSNYASIDLRSEMEGHLRSLDDGELEKLTSMLGFRTCYPKISGLTTTRDLSQEVLLSAFERRKTFQEAVADMSVLPTEAALYEESLLRNEVYDGSRPLAIPKLNLQYLSSGDFLWRSFILHRCEQFFEIRRYLEDVIKRLRPIRSGGGPEVVFEGFSKVALPISKPAILETAPPKVGSHEPAFVRAEITLNVARLADNVRKDWDALRPEDVVFLVCASPEKGKGMTNGHGAIDGPEASGLRAVRVAEVVMLLDENGRPVREPRPDQVNGYGPRPRIRRLLVNLDPVAFEDDISRKAEGLPDVYEQINLVVRRNKRENNFKKILETVRNLAISEVSIPAWLQDVFLGFGDPTAATYQKLPNHIKALDIRDTIIDWQHLLKSLPGVQIETANEANQGFDPPYVLEDKSLHTSIPPRSSKKRRRDEAELDTEADPASKSVKISTYQTPSTGPYPTDAPKVNEVPFTPTQVQAVISGTQPGLTIIVGPPGTGKTDVATQIISNIYHDFPSQRTLLIAHSNQALNQLFQKITRLDIDGRHLLRLGQGEADLETSESFSKYGRVESFLDNRAMYLAEVDRLAANFGAPGAHGGSCETAGYFNLVYVKPAWKKFWDAVASTSSSLADVVSSFPFYHYFQTAPQPLFPEQASKAELLNIAQGCERHISKIFTELEDIRPFEILRSNKDKTNYLMIKEARIIAMTSTHAAMRRQEIAQLGFHYDNVVMEEAAQITEIENFIPLALQRPKDGQTPLQRIVLCGDHLQNSPIVQNLAFRHFANLEQSLFLRLVRLGVPTINLDAQGRARASLAALYRWRYPNLDNLPNVQTEPEFLLANAGFRYDYQFIDIPDYKGRGEMQPSPHFVQNLGEAEYAVALYQYMRLLGYPASKISILTTYAGQRALIRDVLTHRCAGNRLFGMPRIVSTVDKYQGEQNDYVILSLVRTSRPGYLRDLRRLTVALSRARLGLYILGRRHTFDSAPDISQAFELPLQRPEHLMITTGEMYPAEGRLLDDDVPATEMVGVEHLGQYVYEMTQAKVKMLKEGAGVLPPLEPEQLLDIDGNDDLAPGGEAGDEVNDRDGDAEVGVEEVL